MPSLVPLGKGSLEHGDHLLEISDLIKHQNEVLQREVEEIVEQKFNAVDQKELRQLKLDLKLEKNDIRMRKYFEVVREFEHKYRLVRENIDHEKSNIVSIHDDCAKIHEKVQNAETLQKVVKMKSDLLEVIASPEFSQCYKREEYIELAQSVDSSMLVNEEKIVHNLTKIDQLLLDWHKGLQKHLSKQKKAAKRGKMLKACSIM